jgi:hypothetical protein
MTVRVRFYDCIHTRMRRVPPRNGEVMPQRGKIDGGA